MDSVPHRILFTSPGVQKHWPVLFTTSSFIAACTLILITLYIFVVNVHPGNKYCFTKNFLEKNVKEDF